MYGKHEELERQASDATSALIEGVVHRKWPGEDEVVTQCRCVEGRGATVRVVAARMRDCMAKEITIETPGPDVSHQQPA